MFSNWPSGSLPFEKVVVQQPSALVLEQQLAQRRYLLHLQRWRQCPKVRCRNSFGWIHLKGTVHKTRRSSDHPYVYIRRMYTVAAIQLLRSTAWSILAYWLQLYLSTAGPVAVGCSTLLHVLHRPLLLYPMSPEVCSIWVWQMQPHLSVDSSLVALGRTADRGTASS